MALSDLSRHHFSVHYSLKDVKLNVMVLIRTKLGVPTNFVEVQPTNTFDLVEWKWLLPYSLNLIVN